MSGQAMALSERADACFAALDAADQAIARRVFVRLVRFDDGQADAAQPQPRAALRASEEPSQLAQLLRHLAEARLVTLDGDQAGDDVQVALADEALIAAWPTLGAWLSTHRGAELLRRRLESEAAEWSQRTSAGRTDVWLLDKKQLNELTAGLTEQARRDLGVSETAESFLTASRDALRRRWWPWPDSGAAFLVIVFMCMLAATPIVLLFIVVLSAWVIHRTFG